MNNQDIFNPELHLKFEREVDLPRAKIWRAWTSPDLLKEWFCPRPWRCVEAEVDLRPGGRFNTAFQSPEGQRHVNRGSYLLVRDAEELVFTDAFTEGFVPSENSFATCRLTLTELAGGKTKYTAVAMHKNAADREAHAKMGFEAGWSAALDQMIALMRARS